MAKKKVYKTIEENAKGKNLKSINLKTLSETENKKLIQKAKKGELPGYHVVNSGKSSEFLRSNPDQKKKNNLDPKLNKSKKR